MHNSPNQRLIPYPLADMVGLTCWPDANPPSTAIRDAILADTPFIDRQAMQTVDAKIVTAMVLVMCWPSDISMDN